MSCLTILDFINGCIALCARDTCIFILLAASLRVNSSVIWPVNNFNIFAVNLVINEKGNINKNYKGELIVNSKEGAIAKFNFNLNYFKKEEIKEIPIANETNVSIPPPITQKKSNMLRNIIITIIFILFILAGYFIYKKSKKPKMKIEDLFR